MHGDPKGIIFTESSDKFAPFHTGAGHLWVIWRNLKIVSMFGYSTGLQAFTASFKLSVYFDCFFQQKLDLHVRGDKEKSMLSKKMVPIKRLP